MKLFFASDLHGSLDATEQVLAAYLSSGAEHLVILGDVLNHGPRNPVPESYNPPKVAELLNAHSDSIIAVRGNCDSEVDQMLLAFPMMADYAWVMLANGQRLFLTHGHLYNAEKRPALKRGDVIAHGTHIYRLRSGKESKSYSTPVPLPSQEMVMPRAMDYLRRRL